MCEPHPLCDALCEIVQGDCAQVHLGESVPIGANCLHVTVQKHTKSIATVRPCHATVTDYISYIQGKPPSTSTINAQRDRGTRDIKHFVHRHVPWFYPIACSLSISEHV